MRRGLLDVSQRPTGVEGSGDEAVAEAVRTDFVHRHADRVASENAAELVQRLVATDS